MTEASSNLVLGMLVVRSSDVKILKETIET